MTRHVPRGEAAVAVCGPRQMTQTRGHGCGAHALGLVATLRAPLIALLARAVVCDLARAGLKADGSRRVAVEALGLAVLVARAGVARLVLCRFVVALVVAIVPTEVVRTTQGRPRRLSNCWRTDGRSD